MLARPLVMDAAALEDLQFRLTEDAFEIGSGTDAQVLSRDAKSRGWLRRLAPATWRTGVISESVEAAEKASWLSLVTAVIRSLDVTWLTHLDAIAAAENKMYVHAVAATIGVTTPRSVITSSPASIRNRLRDPLVIKPLVSGHFQQDGYGWNVFAHKTMSADLNDGLAQAPFLVQEQIQAVRHLRVVTVNDHIWTTAITAARFPVDWRSQAQAHESFTATQEPDALVDAAMSVAQSLNLGYSSQDWIDTGESFVLLDVNPGGQWLFLPSEVTTSVSQKIGRWLDGA